MIHLPTAYFTD